MRISLIDGKLVGNKFFLKKWVLFFLIVNRYKFIEMFVLFVD